MPHLARLSAAASTRIANVANVSVSVTPSWLVHDCKKVALPRVWACSMTSDRSVMSPLPSSTGAGICVPVDKSLICAAEVTMDSRLAVVLSRSDVGAGGLPSRSSLPGASRASAAGPRSSAPSCANGVEAPTGGGTAWFPLAWVVGPAAEPCGSVPSSSPANLGEGSVPPLRSLTAGRRAHARRVRHGCGEKGFMRPGPPRSLGASPWPRPGAPT